MVISYCERSGSSRGVREYLSNQLIPFATANPQLQIVAQQRPMRHPFVHGEYVNEDEKKKLRFLGLVAAPAERRTRDPRFEFGRESKIKLAFNAGKWAPDEECEEVW